jgi:hypothetical protein
MLLYAGEAAAATRLLDAELAEFNASACARGVYYRLTLTYLVGRCCLAQAKEDARSRGALLRRAEGCAQYLMKLPHPHSHALGMLIHAEAALRGGRDEQAHDWLRACAEGSKTHQAPMFACYAERALGVLVGGAAGAEIVCRSDLQLRQEGVRAPERWARFWVDMER